MLGRTYAEIGNDARSNHKCQGVGGVPPLPGGAGGRGGRGGGGGTYTLVDTTIPGQMDKDETSFFDGVDTSLAGLSRFAGPAPPSALTEGLRAVVGQAERARQAFASGDDAATAPPIEAGLAAVRALRASLGSLGLSDTARYEIDFRLKIKEQDYQDAVLAAHDLTFQVVADDGLVIDGQPVRLSLIGVNRGRSDVTVSDVAIAGFDDPAACASANLKPDAVFTCIAAATVPKNAKLTDPYFTDTYWKNPSGPADNAFDPGVPFGVPFAPTPFHVVFHVKAGSVEVAARRRARRIPLREGSLFWRQADGAERRAGVLRRGDADAGDLSPPPQPASTGRQLRQSAREPRDLRLRDQQHEEGRRERRRDAGAARRLDGDAGLDHRELRQGGRVAVRPLRHRRAGARDGRRSIRQGVRL